MSNDSSPSMLWFSGGSYIRVLAATPPEDSPPDFFYSPERTFIYDNRPIQRPITPRPITPEFVGDYDQCGQRFLISPRTPPALRIPLFRYSEMTPSRDSGCFTYQESQINRSLSPINLNASPDMFSPTTPGAYALSLIHGMEYSPSPPRQSQMDEWLRSLTPISPSMLSIERSQALPEYDLLIFGRLLNTTQNETDWAEDGYNDILAIHMFALEGEWYKDGADEILNLHMDAYESRVGE